MYIPNRLLKKIDILSFEKYGKILDKIRKLIGELRRFDCDPKTFKDEMKVLEKLKLKIMRGFINKSLKFTEWFKDYCKNFDLETGLPLQKVE